MTKQRNSSIEFMKCLAMLLIVLNHVTQTLTKLPNTDFLLGYACPSLAAYILYLFRNFGGIGNAFFMVCTAWFLVDSNNAEGKKIFRMLANVWVISVAILIAYEILAGGVLRHDIIRSLFPSTFLNNWYISCYMLLYGKRSVLGRMEKCPRKCHTGGKRAA